MCLAPRPRGRPVGTGRVEGKQDVGPRRAGRVVEREPHGGGWGVDEQPSLDGAGRESRDGEPDSHGRIIAPGGRETRISCPNDTRATRGLRAATRRQVKE